MKTGLSMVTHYLPGEILDSKKYYTYLQPEIDKLPDNEKRFFAGNMPDQVHRLKDPSALEILGLMAGQHALDAYGISPLEIDGLITAQSGGKQFMPLFASYLQLNLGLRTGIIARNVNDGDVGLLSGINLAGVYLKSGLCRKILVIGAAALIGGKYGFGADLTDPWCMQFGDGSAACILTAEEEPAFEILGFHFETEAVSCRVTGTLNSDYGPIRAPKNRDLCFAAEMDDKHGAYVIGYDEKFLETAGRRGFFAGVLKNAAEKAGLSLEKLDHIIPAHNAVLIPGWEKELVEAGAGKDAIKHLQKTIGHAGNADTLIDLSAFDKAGAFAPGETIALAAPCAGVQTAVLILKKTAK